MKQLLVAFSIYIFAAKAYCQRIAPGNVGGVSFWYVTDSNQLRPAFKSNLQENTPYIALQNSPTQPGYLNHYPSLRFSGTSQLPVDLGNVDLSHSSYFTVYKADNLSVENIIWHTKKNHNPELILSSSRMADLANYGYMNYTDIIPLNPKVHSYIQQKEKDSVLFTSQFLSIGSKPAFPQLPVVGFKGLIPEIIIYDRVLDWEEQVRVSSYLALKYGVTLTEPGATYLNSAGELIWDGASYSTYHNNIAGIGRDDSSGLYQRISSSSNNPELFAVSTNENLKNKNFLLWGDNALPLIIGEKIAGVPNLLQRKWLAVPHGIVTPVSVTISADTKQLDVELPDRPVYWLAIDRSGTTNFGLEGTEYIRMNSIDIKGRVYFNEVILNKVVNEREVLGLVVAQDLLVASVINSPACGQPDGGSLQIKIFGGQAPYHIVIAKNNVVVNQITINNNDPLTIQGISAGQYQMKVSDEKKHVYIDEFYINNTDAPQSKAIATSYVLQEGYQLPLNAADQSQSGLKYEWEGPENFHSSNAEVILNKAGIYTLKVSNGGCSFVQQIRIVRPPKNIFKSIKVYPSPSRGLFTIKMSLDKPAAVNMNIYAADGRHVTTRQFKGFANYTFTDELFANGLYYLVFSTGLSKETQKLIILK